ncbi:hypothetical protein ACFVYP_04935 [Kitasatospora sp. NPDC058201]|uniref:hypothetical protein n=1 Tax=Streptomycetaceae TaxID=2062 RepID=UPI002E772300|nr:hypothetical protein [Streptomyces sp. BE303]MED7947837.1 hypothetical protein [Streptomyces sp. BE303]
MLDTTDAALVHELQRDGRVMFSEDLFAVDPKAFLEARADLTVVGGEVVHRAD